MYCANVDRISELFIFDWQVGFTNVYLDSRNHNTFLRALLMQYVIGLWCLTLFSVIFQLYRGGHFVFWCRKPEYPEETTDLPQVTLSHNDVSSTPRLS